MEFLEAKVTKGQRSPKTEGPQDFLVLNLASSYSASSYSSKLLFMYSYQIMALAASAPGKKILPMIL